MKTWRPIETAPRDESVLVYIRDAAGGLEYEIAHCSSHDPYADWYLSTVDGPPIDVPPTHWTPLPEPPGAARMTVIDILRDWWSEQDREDRCLYAGVAFGLVVGFLVGLNIGLG